MCDGNGHKTFIMAITITQLMLFPVKSLRGFSLTQATLTETGLAFDRHWMIINEKNHFVTQRQAKHKDFTLINTRLTETHLVLSKVGMSDCEVSLHMPKAEGFDATIWKDTLQVVDEGSDVSRWLTEAANSSTPLRLVRKAPNCKRPQSKPDVLGEETHTHFADSAPLLVANNASLAALNEESAQLERPLVSMEHFRPNIVISGIAAYEEHKLKQLSHEHYHIGLCYPCQRCVVITIDPNTGKRYDGQHPFKQLAGQNSMPNFPKAPAFGENAIVTLGLNETIAVGDYLKAGYTL